MISIDRSLRIEIEIIDASEAISNQGFLATIASKIPVLNRAVDRKVEEKIENEINIHLSAESIQRQINRALSDNGVQARVRVS